MRHTVFIYKNYRFFFFSREESRIHVHITCHDGEAKFWLEPIIALAYHYKLSEKQLKELQTIIEERKNEIRNQWQQHFGD